MHAHPYARLTQLRRERLLRQHMNASRLADVEVLPDGQHATTVSCLADAVSWFMENHNEYRAMHEVVHIHVRILKP